MLILEDNLINVIMLLSIIISFIIIFIICIILGILKIFRHIQRSNTKIKEYTLLDKI